MLAMKIGPKCQHRIPPPCVGGRGGNALPILRLRPVVGDEHGAGGVRGQAPEGLAEKEEGEGTPKGVRETRDEELGKERRPGMTGTATLEAGGLRGEEVVVAAQRHEEIVGNEEDPLEPEGEHEKCGVPSPAPFLPESESGSTNGEDRILLWLRSKEGGEPWSEGSIHAHAMVDEEDVSVFQMVLRGRERVVEASGAHKGMMAQVAVAKVQPVSKCAGEAAPE